LTTNLKALQNLKHQNDVHDQQMRINSLAMNSPLQLGGNNSLRNQDAPLANGNTALFDNSRSKMRMS